MMSTRQSVRHSVEPALPITFSHVPFAREMSFTIDAKMVNRSDGGMCVMTDHAIAPGWVVLADGTEEKSGMVVWSAERTREEYQVGIQFLPPELAISFAAFRELRHFSPAHADETGRSNDTGRKKNG